MAKDFEDFNPVEYFKVPIGELGSSYSQNVCRHAIHKKNGGVEKIGDVICVAFLNRCPALNGMKGFWGSLWNKDPDLLPHAKYYWQFLFDENISPYRPLLKDHRIIRDGETPIAYYLTTTKETSSQYFANFLIATRLPYEHADSLKAFAFFMARGFTPHEALLFSHTLRLNGGDKRTYFQEADCSHIAFDSHARIPLQRLIEASPVLLDTKIARGDCYRPCNAIWNDGNNHSLILETLSKGEPYTGVFKKKFQNEIGQSFENGLETNPEKVVTKLMEIRGQL